MKQSHNDYTSKNYYELVDSQGERIVRGNYQQMLDYRKTLYKKGAYKYGELFINNLHE